MNTAADGFIGALEALVEGSTHFQNTMFVRQVVGPQLKGEFTKQDEAVYKDVFGDRWLSWPQGYRPNNMWRKGADTAIELAEVASNRMVERHKQFALEGLATHFGIDIEGLFDDHWSRDFDRANNDIENYQPESFRYALDTLNAIKFALEAAS